MAAVDDQDPIQQFAAHSADPLFSDRVVPRRRLRLMRRWRARSGRLGRCIAAFVGCQQQGPASRVSVRPPDVIMLAVRWYCVPNPENRKDSGSTQPWLGHRCLPARSPVVGLSGSYEGAVRGSVHCPERRLPVCRSLSARLRNGGLERYPVLFVQASADWGCERVGEVVKDN